ncbi:MOSC N-terminal beta barrel domain-containing protein [Nocardioides dubius]|uniref:MOSC domain-containing protein n=1 Tax=Nocardioides dubius TaxID=317019 RepID=A0ABP4EG98_9ACTN
MTVSLAAIRRYPVKSMGGEELARVVLDSRGLVGDRWFAVVDAEGRLSSGKNSRRFRRRDAVFDYAAQTEGEQVLVTRGDARWRVGADELDVELSAAMGAAVRVLPENEVPHFDDGPISLIGTATLAWCAERGIDADPRRLRVNLLLETAEPFVEEGWLGTEVTLGGAALRIVDRVPRCRMIDIDQDGAAARGEWLKLLGAEREACAAVYAAVVRPGEVTVGDRLTR